MATVDSHGEETVTGTEKRCISLQIRFLVSRDVGDSGVYQSMMVMVSQFNGTSTPKGSYIQCQNR